MLIDSLENQKGEKHNILNVEDSLAKLGPPQRDIGVARKPLAFDSLAYADRATLFAPIMCPVVCVYPQPYFVLVYWSKRKGTGSS